MFLDKNKILKPTYVIVSLYNSKTNIKTKVIILLHYNNGFNNCGNEEIPAPNTYHGSNSCMILSKRMTAKSREAKPEIQASKRTVKVIRELRPTAFVRVDDFICLVVGLLSGNMTFALAVLDDEDDDEEGDDLFGSMFCRLCILFPRALMRDRYIRV